MYKNRQIMNFLVGPSNYVYSNSVLMYSSIIIDSPLFSAVKDGNVENVRRLVVQEGEDVMETDDIDYTPLHHAAKIGNIEIMEILINNGSDISKKNMIFVTPLMSAVINGKTNAVKFLLEKGADVTQRDMYDYTMLHIVSDTPSDNIDMVELLLKHGIDIESKDNNGSTPLHIAVARGKFKVVEELIYNGANIRATNKIGETPYSISLQLEDKKIKEFFDLQESMPDVKEVDESDIVRHA